MNREKAEYSLSWEAKELQKKIEFLILVLALIGIYAVSRNLEKYVQSDQVKSVNQRQMNTVVIDSGHGGSDPGKVGINDVLEKDINLKIAKRVEKELKEKGYKVVMTREKDEMLTKEDSGNIKVKDMKARVELINETAPGLAVSIHQNSYHEEEIHGAQVFYFSHSEEGMEAAKLIQQSLLSVDEENKRQEKANDTYYLLRRTQVPTVIVECGFLSNQKEAEHLIQKNYQDKIAKAIVEGIDTYLKKVSASE